jgi:hypothetical protein
MPVIPVPQVCVNQAYALDWPRARRDARQDFVLVQAQHTASIATKLAANH